MAIGETNVRITKLYTVPTGAVSNEHNLTPNWVYNNAPTGTMDLRIEAEAGEDIFGGASPYSLYIYAVCLDTPALNIFVTPAFVPAGMPFAEALALASGWKLDAREGTYKKTWSYTVPPGGFVFWAPNHTYQYIVSLIENVGPTRRVASTMLSEPFCVI